MTITERLMGVGAWSLDLDPATPQSVLQGLRLRDAGRGHLVVFPTWVDAAALDDEDALALARYTGIYLKQDRSTLTLSGMGVNGWLGDGKRGRSTQQATTRTFEGWTTFVTPDYLGTGIRSTIAGNFKVDTGPVFFNDLANLIADRYGAAWRVTNDFKLDFGTYAALFRESPTALITRHTADSGRDFDVHGVTGDLELVEDIEDWARRVVYWYEDESSGPTAIIQDGGVDPGDAPFRGPDGSAAFVDVLVEDSETDNATDATALSLAQWGRFRGVRQEISLSSTEYDIGRDIGVGDNLFVFDHDRGIYDMGNPVTYRGQVIYPDVIRCVGYSWPVRAGMGVWFRRHRKVDSSWVLEWTDLTPYVRWETGAATVDVGAKPRAMT